MRKRYAALFLALALLVSLSSACGQRGTDGSAEGPGGAAGQRPSSSEIAVSELYSEDGTGFTSEGTEYAYSYHVPQIEDDTPGAAAINAEIAATYGAFVRACLDCVESGEIPPSAHVTYERFQYGHTLSLLIQYTYYYGGDLAYGAYNYDTEQGVQLSNADLLAVKGVTQEQYLDAARRAAAKCYDDLYFPIWEAFGFDNDPGAYQERRSWTISAKNITPELPLYLDNSGAMHTIASIGSHTGADWTAQDLLLDFTDKHADTETMDLCDFLQVTRQGRNVTLRLSETELGKTILEAGGLDYYPSDIEYTVHGLWGDYTQVYCGLIGLQDAPFVFLLTEEGRVEYIDVITCLKGGYFCAGGPLLGVDDVRSLDANIDYDNGAFTVYAILGDGSSVNLAPFIAADQLSMSESYLGDWACQRTAMADGESCEEYVSLTLSGCDSIRMACYQPELGTAMECEGYLTYLGMTENGAVYCDQLWWINSNGPGVSGVIALETEYDNSGDIPTRTLHMTELAGTPLIGYRTGETTVLVQSFG